MSSLLNQVLTEHYRVVCETCDKVFLDITGLEFAQKHSTDNARKDRWYNEAVKHFCLNPAHKILCYIPIGQVFDLSQRILDECQHSNLLLTALYIATLAEEELSRGNPI